MAVLATDNFDRANNADLGASWTPISGLDNFKIQSNVAVPNNVAGSDAGETYTAIGWPNDQYGQVAVDVSGGASTTGVGVILRQSGTDYYRVVVAGAGANNVAVELRPAGGTLATRTQTFSAGDILRAEIRGSTIRIYINGVQMGADITEGSLASGSVGIAFSSTVTSGSVDNFEGGSLDPVLKFDFSKFPRPKLRI